MKICYFLFVMLISAAFAQNIVQEITLNLQKKTEQVKHLSQQPQKTAIEEKIISQKSQMQSLKPAQQQNMNTNIGDSPFDIKYRRPKQKKHSKQARFKENGKRTHGKNPYQNQRYQNIENSKKRAYKASYHLNETQQQENNKTLNFIFYILFALAIGLFIKSCFHRSQSSKRNIKRNSVGKMKNNQKMKLNQETNIQRSIHFHTAQIERLKRQQFTAS